jgi:hypothetical protein
MSFFTDVFSSLEPVQRSRRRSSFALPFVQFRVSFRVFA